MGYFAAFLGLFSGAGFSALALSLADKNSDQTGQGDNGRDNGSDRLPFEDAVKNKRQGNKGESKCEDLPQPAFFNGMLDYFVFVFPPVFGFLFRHGKNAVRGARQGLLVTAEFFGGRQWADIH